jgi:hypothetical protein
MGPRWKGAHSLQTHGRYGLRVHNECTTADENDKPRDDAPPLTCQERYGGDNDITMAPPCNCARRQELARRRWSRPTCSEQDRLVAIGEAVLDAYGGDLRAWIVAVESRSEPCSRRRWTA